MCMELKSGAAHLKTATGFQSDIQGIANQGYNRLLKGSSLAEEQSRFDLGLTAGAMVERLPINEVLLQTRR